MYIVICYLIIILMILLGAAMSFAQGLLPEWLQRYSLLYMCALAGGFGGITYCLRGVYLNACVFKRWDDVWRPWYFIRPIVSVLCGAVSYVFLQAGLLVLEVSQKSDSTHLGFVALAFIAGLNVDKFIAKIEDIAQATWGIEKSRTASKEEENV